MSYQMMTASGTDGSKTDGYVYAAGWKWTYQEYDWKGRVKRTVNTDGTDTLASYDGCGCAGGQITTIQSELVPRDDQPTINARRTQKIYADILGRTYKTEVMQWDGVTPYTTTVQTFNGRDQVTKTRQYAGAENINNTYQDVVITYDGHGRLKTRHYPIEVGETTWIYNNDNSIQQVIDPRGAITNFAYADLRGLLTSISYQVPSGSSIPVTPTTTFAYDAAGNRTSMTTTNLSTTTYSYDQLSRLTSETIDFNDLTNNLSIGYSYHLGGALKSITDPFNTTVNYTNDKTGRVSAVSGTAWGQNTTGNYASNIRYRAFGGVKQMDYTMPNDTIQIKLDYDTRLRVEHHEVTAATTSGSFLMKADFAYSADSRVQAKDDKLDDKWDRTMKYDYAGRLVYNQFGLGLGADGFTYKRVYEQTIGYDAFSQMVFRSGTHWDNSIGYTEGYTNGRINSNPDIIYDAAGNIVQQGNLAVNPHEYQNTTFDASGRRTVSHSSSKERWGSRLNMVTEHKTEYQYDGEGRPVVDKDGYYSYHISEPPPPVGWTPAVRSYQVWSSVLGSSLTTVLPDESKSETKVFAGGAVIATQNPGAVAWKTADPVTGTVGNFGFYNGETYITTEETEPLGQTLRQNDPAEPPQPQPNDPNIGSADYPQWQCTAGEDFYGSFSAMPFHCQQKALYGAGSVLPWEYEITKSPNKINEYADSPIRNLGVPYSVSDNILVYALKSTSKADNDPESPKNRSKREFRKE